MIRFLLALALALVSVPASAQGPLGGFPLAGFFPLTTYVGPGDVIPGATAWYGLRGYSSGIAGTGNVPAITVRRASNNALANIVILTTGALDIATANGFAGTDAVCTGTAAASTTISFTGCTSTPTAGDTLTSTGGTGAFTQPVYIASCGSFTGGAGSCTLNTAQTVTGVTVTAQIALLVTKIFDQSGNGVHLTQSTNATQPQLLPSCLNGLPCLYFNGSQMLVNATTCAATGQPWFAATVATSLSNNQGGTAGGGNIFQLCIDSNNHENRTFFNQAGNQFGGANGVAGAGANAAINVAHALSIYSPFFGNLGSILVDGSFTSANASAIGQAWNGGFGAPGAALGGDNFGAPNQFGTIYLMEAGSWQIPATQNQQTNVCANQNTYWFTGSLSCTAVAPTAYTPVTGPCDIVACSEAWSVTRAMRSNYTGPLFQLYNGTNVLDIGQNTTTRAADMTTWSTFCSGVASNCKFSRIYAQIQNTNNDMVAVNYPVSSGCQGIFSFTPCMATFTIEGATGLPVVISPGQAQGLPEYSANSLAQSGITSGTYGDDAPLIGVATGTAPGTVVVNSVSLTSATTNCCGMIGPAHKFNVNPLQSGSDVQQGGAAFAAAPTNMGIAGEGLGGLFDGNNIPLVGQANAVQIYTHQFNPVPKNTGWFNGVTSFEHSPAQEPTNMYSGPYIHMGGGGDLSQPQTIDWRETLLTNDVMTLANKNLVFANETAFYSGLTFPSPTAYQGPGDIVPGASAWYGLRGYTAAFNGPAVNVRRGNDNQTQDINITATGNLDLLGANTFAGIDATCTGSTSGISSTLSLTGCSSTPHAGDQVYSVVWQCPTPGCVIHPPSYLVSCGSFAGGTGSCVLNYTPAAIIGAQTISFLNPLFVTKLYDQTGNGNHMVQATGANQPQLLTSCFLNTSTSAGTTPCLLFTGSQWLSAPCGPPGLPASINVVAQRSANFTTAQDVFDSCGNGTTNNSLGFSNSSNTVALIMGATLTVGSINDGVPHEIQAVTPATSGNSTLVIDNNTTTGAAGNTWTGGNAGLGASSTGVKPFSGLVGQAGNWPIALSGSQISALCKNDSIFWFYPYGSPLTC